MILISAPGVDQRAAAIELQRAAADFDRVRTCGKADAFSTFDAVYLP